MHSSFSLITFVNLHNLPSCEIHSNNEKAYALQHDAAAKGHLNEIIVQSTVLERKLSRCSNKSCRNDVSSILLVNIRVAASVVSQRQWSESLKPDVSLEYDK